MISLLTFAALTSLVLLPPVLTHGGHQVPISDDADWATRHMAGMFSPIFSTLSPLKPNPHPQSSTKLTPPPPRTEEHHIANLDPSAFFTLHDYENNGVWSANDIRRTYGLDDETAKAIDEGKKTDVVKGVLGIFDRDGDGLVSREEWMDGWVREGKRLPDFGLGPGHHGDDEYEYEIHHFEKFHDENTKEEDLTHPEDIAHFRKHDQMDAAAEYQERIDSMPIVEQNIPQKFRRY